MVLTHSLTHTSHSHLSIVDAKDAEPPRTPKAPTVLQHYRTDDDSATITAQHRVEHIMVVDKIVDANFSVEHFVKSSK